MKLENYQIWEAGWNALGGRHDTFNFDGWCSETRVGGKMVLEISSENRQCQGRGWAAYSRHGIQSMRMILKWSLMFSSMVIEEEDWSDRVGVYLGRIRARYKGCWWSSTLKAVVGDLEIESMANREPVKAGQNWRDVAVPRLFCNNSSKRSNGILNHLKAIKMWCRRACKKRITIVEPRAESADYCHGYISFLLVSNEVYFYYFHPVALVLEFGNLVPLFLHLTILMQGKFPTFSLQDGSLYNKFQQQ